MGVTVGTNLFLADFLRSTYIPGFKTCKLVVDQEVARNNNVQNNLQGSNYIRIHIISRSFDGDIIDQNMFMKKEVSIDIAEACHKKK
jgi:hypothetical protein